MSNKIKPLCCLVILLITIIIAGATVHAATSVTTAAVSVTITQDDGATAISGLTAGVYDAAGNDITSTLVPDNSVTGTFTFRNFTAKGNYLVMFAKGSDKLTIPVSITSFKTDPFKVKTAWVDKNSLSLNKSGIISDITLKNDGSALSGVTVKAYNTKGTWETQSDSNGMYKLYLPAGAYTLITVGKDSNGIDYKNLYTSVKVYAGQKTGSMTDQNAETAWGASEAALGYGTLSLTNSSKTVTGIANVGCTASAYVVDPSTGVYKFLASSQKISGKKGDNTGRFTINLPDYQPGKEISIKIADSAFNIFEDKTYVNTPLPNRTMTLTATTPSAVSSTINTPVIVSLRDTNTSAMTSFLSTRITSVSAQHTGDAAIPLVKDIDYKAESGKITITKGKLSIAQDYVITVVADGYNTASTTQTVAPSKAAAGQITGSFAVTTGSAFGTTQFTSIGTAGTGNSLVYEIVQPSSSAQCRDNVLTGTSTPLVKGTDISGVDAITNSCIDIYEVNVSTKVVNYKRVVLTAAVIKMPAILSAVVNGNTLTLTTDIMLDIGSKPNPGSFPVKVNGIVKTVDSVAISGSSVVLTLHSTVKSSDSVTAAYNKPLSGFLQNASGNTVPSKTAMQVTNNTAPVVLVTGITVTGAGNAAAISTTGGALQMSATVMPSNATNQTYTWSVIPGTGAATIDQSGLLAAVQSGTVTVKATAKDGSGVCGTLVITISNQTVPVSSITVSGAGSATTIDVMGGTLQMSAAVLPSNASNQACTWSVTPGTGTATIDLNGLLTATSNGTVTVTSAANDGSGVTGTEDITISNQ